METIQVSYSSSTFNINQWKPPAPAACRHRDESGQDGFAGAKLTVTASDMTSLPLSVGPHSEELAIEQIKND